MLAQRGFSLKAIQQRGFKSQSILPSQHHRKGREPEIGGDNSVIERDLACRGPGFHPQYRNVREEEGSKEMGGTVR